MVIRLLTWALISLIFLSSCQKKDSLPHQNILKLSIPEDPMTLDPRRGGDVVSSHLHFMLFEGLTSLNEDGSVSLAQAHKVDVSKDLKTYTFHLGKTRWSDGSVVSSYDFEKAWKHILLPSFPSPNAHLFYIIKGAEEAKKGLAPIEQVGICAPNPETLVIELKQPTPYFLQLISFCVFFPVHTTLDEAHPDWAFNSSRHFISNGPFLLKKWRHHNDIYVEKNPLYRAKEQIMLQGIQMHVIASEMTSFQMFENGELDFVGHPFSMLPQDAIDTLYKSGQLQTTAAAATTLISYNLENTLLKNENLRLAFSLAIDRAEIVKNLTQLDESVAEDAVPPSLKMGHVRGMYKDCLVEKAQFHLDLAIRELKISKKELNQLTFYHSAMENHHKVAQVLQQQWLKNLGVTIHLQSMEHKTLVDKLSKRNYEMALTIWRAQFHDPISILERFKSKGNIKNYPGWENNDFRDLLEASSMQSQLERLHTLERAEEIFLREMPIAPLYHWNFCYLAKPHVKNIQFSPVGGIFFERLTIEHDP